MTFLRIKAVLVPTLIALCFSAGVTAASPQEPAAGQAPAAEVSSIVSRTPPVNPSPTSGPGNLNRVGVQTAQPLSLSLIDAIRKALENNNDIEISRDDVRFQETQVRSLLGVYDPVFRTAPNFSRSQSTGEPATKDFRVNTDISQFIRPGGGNYQAFFNNSRTENAFAQAQASSGTITSASSALYTSSLGFNFTQPLARNMRIDSRRHSITIAKKRLEQTDSDFRLQATETITQVQRAYWDLVFALRDQQNQVANVNLAKENLRQIEAKIDAGASAPLERAEVATELANREGTLLLATQQVSISENTLKQLVIKDPLSSEWSETYMPTDKPVFSLDPTNLDDALKDAMDNRFELKRLKLQTEINASDISYFKNQTKPQIDLNTTFSMDGLSRSGTNAAFTTNVLTSAQDLFIFNALNATRGSLALTPIINPSILVPASPSYLFGGFNRSLSNMFRSDSPNFSIGVTISFPFRNRTAKANLDGAKVQEHQLAAQTRGQEQVVLVEVRNAVQAVETTRQRVLTARRARENAEIQLDGERKLYEAGKSTTFLLFTRENTLTNARNAEIRAETDHNKALSELQRATATSFKANNITIDTPVQIQK